MSGRPALANKNTYHRTSGTAGNASAKKTAKKPGKRAKQAQDVSNAVEQKRAYETEIASLKSQLDKLKAANDSNTSPSTPTELVPRPIGSHGSQYNVGKELIKNHGVSKQEYNKMMATARYSLKAARLSGHWKKMDLRRLGQVFNELRKEFPVLQKFEADWVSAENTKQALKNWRAKENRDRKIAGTNVDGGDEEAEMGDEQESDDGSV